MEEKGLPKDIEKIPEDFDKSIVADYLSQEWMHPILNEFLQSMDRNIHKMVPTPAPYKLLAVYEAKPEHGNIMDFWNTLTDLLRRIYRSVHQHLSIAFQKTALAHDEPYGSISTLFRKSRASLVRIGPSFSIYSCLIALFPGALQNTDPYQECVEMTLEKIAENQGSSWRNIPMGFCQLGFYFIVVIMHRYISNVKGKSTPLPTIHIVTNVLDFSDLSIRDHMIYTANTLLMFLNGKGKTKCYI